jgi:hypothetical protein
MKSLAFAFASVVLSGCAVLDPHAQSLPDPWYASPPPVYVHPGYGWTSPHYHSYGAYGAYGSPYGGHPYYAPPHRRLRAPGPAIAAPAGRPAATASPPPRVAQPSGPRPQYGHAEESFLRIDVPAPPPRAPDNAPYGRHDQP